MASSCRHGCGRGKLGPGATMGRHVRRGVRETLGDPLLGGSWGTGVWLHIYKHWASDTAIVKLHVVVVYIFVLCGGW